MGKMPRAAREKVLIQVIKVLLGVGSSQKRESARTQLRKVVVSEAVEQSLARIGFEGRTNIGANYAAVHQLLSQMKVSTAVVDFVVTQCFARAREARVFYGAEALSHAAHFLAYGASRPVAEKVVAELARAGFYGRIEAVANRCLGRGLLPKEMHALVDAYCADTACQSTAEEKHLGQMAFKYLSSTEAIAACKKLKDFQTEFNSHID